ncbi:Inorganic phosphate transporter pho84 [Linnemannia gamsii]|uniref:Inorganic phosphate transporter pho84 n=1 Tax=Linnemannia gamsii TaxID=64522 RepID=A0ABQ7KG33_9FUNG|nr:Inorganic phosphate transporter pho84 [Linnemannia gamsii]
MKGAYDLILLNLVVPLLSLIYFKYATSPIFTTSHHSTAAVAKTTPFSVLIGQLFFGYLGDAYGHHKFYSLDLMIIIFGTLFCALSSTGGGIDGGGGGTAVIQYLTFWRFVLAFGIGGDYPISATVSSEQAAVTSRRRRGSQLITILTSIQGLGNLMASMVTLMVLIRFRAMIVGDDGEDENDAENMDIVWRICIAVGCLPALSTALIRYTMPGTAPGSGYSANADPQSHFGDALRSGDMIDEDGVENIKSSSTSSSSLPLSAAVHSTSTPSPPKPPSLSKAPRSRCVHATRVFREYCSQWKNLKVLIGTSLSWFLLDLAFRSIALNQSYLLDALDSSSENPQNIDNTADSNNKTMLYRHLWMTSLGNLIISLLGGVPDKGTGDGPWGFGRVRQSWGGSRDGYVQSVGGDGESLERVLFVVAKEECDNCWSCIEDGHYDDAWGFRARVCFPARRQAAVII